MQFNQYANNEQLTFLFEISIKYGLSIVFACIIFIAGRWLAKIISSTINKQMSAKNVDKTVANFAKSIIYYLLMVIVIIASLSQLGIQTASFVAIVGAAGLAVGLALQGSLANFAAGMLLILFRPIKAGDFVEVAGVSGTVKEISVFATTILSGDYKTITVANASVMGGNIINYSTQQRRRIDLIIGVSYDSDLEKVQQELQSLADSDERILKDPAVTIGVFELADSSINLVFRPWVDSDNYWPVRFDLLENVKKRFDEVGISIPFPTMDVNVSKS